MVLRRNDRNVFNRGDKMKDSTAQKLEGFLAGLTCSGDSPYEQGTKAYVNWLSGKFLAKAGNNREKAEQVLVALFNLNQQEV